MQNARVISGIDPSYETAYELYVQGYSYQEIAQALNIDLFKAMAETAAQSKIYALFRRQNQHVDREFMIGMLRRVIKEAWTDHENPVQDKDGVDKPNTALSTIVSAVKVMKDILKDAPSDSTGGGEDDVPMPEGLSIETIRRLGQEEVRSMFPKHMRALEPNH